ncbi:uncharacterized protein METZ01_LOCUS297446 [marine metagenome]|uniref:Uncharacterized protein n=1 Tax=marine metagenome TaxID=408172 RepID=A0A382MAZ9_9ZZZZ
MQEKDYSIESNINPSLELNQWPTLCH